MVNKVFLLGNVGTDPQVSGNETSKMVSFALATQERYRRNNEISESTEWHKVVAFGNQESVNDLFFCFLFCKAECHELHDLLACDLTYRSLVDELGIDIIRLERRNSKYYALIHDEGIALGMAVARCIAGDNGIEFLIGPVSCNST